MENEGLYNNSDSDFLNIEKCVLGCLIVDPNALPLFCNEITEDIFQDNNIKEVYKAVIDLYKEDSPIDIIILSNRLKKRGALEKVGGYKFVATLQADAITSAKLSAYVRILIQRKIRRDVEGVLSEGCFDISDEQKDSLEVLNKLTDKIISINNISITTREYSLKEILPSVVTDIISPEQRKERPIYSGFVELDNITSGFMPGTLSIIAARPGMGKTAFALNVLLNVAKHNNDSAIFFSLEMRKRELGQRLLSIATDIDGERLKGNQLLCLTEKQKILGKSKEMEELPIYIDDVPNGLSVLQLKSKCKRAKAKYDIKIVIIDYLQLMRSSNRAQNREQEISYISRELKALSKDVGVPVIALSQLSRDVEKRGGAKEPQLSDIRESGAIEQDADIVMFIYRPEYYGINQDDMGDTNGIAYINVAKNRAGRTGRARIGFDSSCVKFSNLSIIPNQTYNPQIKEIEQKSSIDYDFEDNIIDLEQDKDDDYFEEF